jgi:hypothetical protein
MASSQTVSLVLEAVDRTGPAIRGANQNLQTLGKTAEQVTRRLTLNMRGLVQATASVTSATLTLYNAYDALGPIQARLLSLEASRQRAQAVVIQLQQQLNEFIKEGKTGSEEYRQVN